MDPRRPKLCPAVRPQSQIPGSFKNRRAGQVYQVGNFFQELLSVHLSLNSTPGIHSTSIVAPCADDINIKNCSSMLPKADAAGFQDPTWVNHAILSTWSPYRLGC